MSERRISRYLCGQACRSGPGTGAQQGCHLLCCHQSLAEAQGLMLCPVTTGHSEMSCPSFPLPCLSAPGARHWQDLCKNGSPFSPSGRGGGAAWAHPQRPRGEAAATQLPGLRASLPATSPRGGRPPSSCRTRDSKPAWSCPRQSWKRGPPAFPSRSLPNGSTCLWDPLFPSAEGW